MAVNQIVLSKAEQARVLQDQITNRAAGGSLHLATNNVTITRDTVVGDFTEAAWTGYASVSLATWPAAAEQGDGIHASSLNGNTPTFLNSSGAGVTFYCVYLLSAAGAYMGGANVGGVTIPAGASEQILVQLTQRAEYASSP